ncbi:PREDICTED: putative disease resistance protein At3g14460-like [Fragaria vesca subsp. vesca]
MRRWQEWSYVGDNKERGAFPSLSRLHLEDCPKLIGILPLDCFPMLQSLRVLNANIEGITMSQGSKCPELSKLRMYDCWNFGYFPEGGLHAPNLTVIDIDGCSNLRSLPEHMNTLLPSLESMSIGLCPKLESFPEGGLPSNLKSLNIRSCKRLIANRMQWGLQELTSLEVLTIDFIRCEDPESFPEEGLMPISLVSLSIYDLLNMKTIKGKELRHLSSLPRMEIWGCPKLECLPDEGLPASLTCLRIEGCPLLKQRCHRDQGEDWPKIAYISNIWIDGNRYHV